MERCSYPKSECFAKILIILLEIISQLAAIAAAMEGRQPLNNPSSPLLYDIHAFFIICWYIRGDSCFPKGKYWEDGSPSENAEKQRLLIIYFGSGGHMKSNGIRKSLKIIIEEMTMLSCWLVYKGMIESLDLFLGHVLSGYERSVCYLALCIFSLPMIITIRPNYSIINPYAFPSIFQNTFPASTQKPPFVGRALVMLLIGIYTMKSDRSLGYHASKNLMRKQSNTTTLTNSSQSKRMRARSFQDEPFPQELARRLLGPKLKPLDLWEEEEEGSVVAEQEEGECLQQKRTIPHFIVMSDHGEFAGRGRPKEALPGGSLQHRCRSVQLLRLPQVDEQKREEDEKGTSRGKLQQFKDRNEFGQRKSMQVTPLMDHDSKEGHCGSVPQRILQAETEEYPLERPNRHDRSGLSSEMEKIKVDEVDQHRRSREEQQDIEEIAEQERQEEETASVKKLRLSLEKLEHEGEYLSKFKEKELRVSIHEEDEQDEETQTKKQPKRGGRVEQQEESSQ